MIGRIIIIGVILAVIAGAQKTISPDCLMKMQAYPSLYTGAGAEYTYNYIGAIAVFVSCTLLGIVFCSLGSILDAQIDTMQQNQMIIDKLSEEDHFEYHSEDTFETPDIFPEGE